MPAKRQTRQKLSVRLSEPLFRRFKSSAAGRGLSLQAATEAALDAWLAKPAASLDSPHGTLRGFLADVDVWAERQHDRATEKAHERRLADIGSRTRGAAR
ncbi:MAG: hypothetical protein EPN33_10645 [Acidobacteria bacterium]|nr:MAG: hypothetical protein EPN33_10645 [Acidobacteriota bacterium]